MRITLISSLSGLRSGIGTRSSPHSTDPRDRGRGGEGVGDRLVEAGADEHVADPVIDRRVGRELDDRTPPSGEVLGTRP